MRASRHLIAVAVAIVGSLAIATTSAFAQVYAYTGSEQSYIVPAGTTLVHVVAVGAPGGKGAFPQGAMGAIVAADLPVPQGQGVLYVEVGGTGDGFNGGGLSNGGDASDVRLLPRAELGSIDSRIIVAGGAGGAGQYRGGNAGAVGGGGPAGGKAGTSTAGGAGGLGQPPLQCADGNPGSLGSGGDGAADFFGPAPFGGGGGGYYGGGGGGAIGGCDYPSFYPTGFGGGGGGSNYVTPQAMNVAMGLDPTRIPTVTITPVTAPSPRPKAVSLSALRVNPSVFVRGGRFVRGHCVARSARNRMASPCRRRLALRISYTLSGPATVTFKLGRAVAGRVVGGRCIQATRRNRHARSCTRLVVLPGSFVQQGTAGRNALLFTGQGGARSLALGDYRLLARPSASGAVQQIARFRIAP